MLFSCPKFDILQEVLNMHNSLCLSHSPRKIIFCIYSKKTTNGQSKTVSTIQCSIKHKMKYLILILLADVSAYINKLQSALIVISICCLNKGFQLQHCKRLIPDWIIKQKCLSNQFDIWLMWHLNLFLNKHTHLNTAFCLIRGHL